MEEFAKMIYRQWLNSKEGEELTWGDYSEAWEKLYEILNFEVADKIETAVNKRVWEIEERAFIEGFGYACKCLSNGKIEFGGR